VELASEVARRQEEDPFWEPLGSGFSYEPVPEAYDEATVGLSQEERVDRVASIVDRCRSAGCTAAGAFTVATTSLRRPIPTASSPARPAPRPTSRSPSTPGGRHGVGRGHRLVARRLPVDDLAQRALTKALAARALATSPRAAPMRSWSPPPPLASSGCSR